MPIRILKTQLQTVQLRTRMPFRYGIATMTDVPEAFLRVWVEMDGREGQGVASDCLPPKWFTKVPEKPLDVEISEMVDVIAHAQRVAEGIKGSSVFDLWRSLYDAQLAWGASRSLPPLLTGFGTSLVERAVIDAVCRLLGRTLFELLTSDALGIELGEVYPELVRVTLKDMLPSAPLARIVARHTVGLGDPLTDNDILDAERLNDGLPQSLEAAIDRYGLRHFKIKVSGKPGPDVERLCGIARVVRKKCLAGFAFSLDGNEQFGSLQEFRDFWRELASRREMEGLFDRLLFVEQPLHRSVALNDSLRAQFADWRDCPPIIIDESDGAVGDVATALDLGYAGTSHKNCKGVIKGVANFALLTSRRSATRRNLIMSGEDLCNIGPVALLQDLAVMGALGIASVERNGHHYHAGLSQFPQAVQDRVIAYHSDLYQRTAQGWPTLCITNGEISLDSINAAPFGSGFSSADCELLT